MSAYNPSNISVNNGNIFGFPASQDSAKIHIVPVAWEVTASFGRGCGKSYEAIRQASLQLDFYDEKGAFWKTKNLHGMQEVFMEYKETIMIYKKIYGIQRSYRGIPRGV